MDLATCPDCTHPKADHSFLGCLNLEPDPCDCPRDFPEAKKTDATAQAESAEAQGRVEVGTDPRWKRQAVQAVEDLAAHTTVTGGGFTPDDVWVLLEERRVPPPREPRALGPILKAMSTGDAATIKSKGFVASKRRHGAPVRVYERREP